MHDSFLPSDAPTLLLTRPRKQSERFAKLCQERLGDVSTIVSPVFRISQVAERVDLSGFEGVILTSGNGALALESVAAVDGIRAWCVGDHTAEVARSMGMRAVSAGGDADALVSMLARKHPEGALLHAHGTNTKGDVVSRLREAGFRAESRIVYEQVPIPLTDAALTRLNGQGPIVLPLFSPRSAQLVGNEVLNAVAPLAIVALSRSVSEAWTGPAPRRLTIAERPDAPNMLEGIAALWTAITP